MKMLLAGGGTGGHLFPAIALAEQLKYEDPQSEILFVGTKRGLESRMLPELGWPLETIDMSGYAGQGTIGKLMVLVKMLKSTHQSRRILQHFKPEIVVGVGGYASVPVLLAAKSMGIPYLVHEQNAYPGLANRLLGRWAKRVCLSFDESDRTFLHGSTVLTGNPVRPAMENCPGIAEDSNCLLVFGGSQGARAINQAMIGALPYLEEWKGRLKIVHQSGDADFEVTVKGYADNDWRDVEVLPFIKDMSNAYAQSTLIVCRAGATTLAELTACGRPAILIPYPHATAGHQSGNAQTMAAKGAALMIEETDLTPERMAKLISGLLHDSSSIQTMAAAARGLAKRGAAARLIQECRAVLMDAH